MQPTGADRGETYMNATRKEREREETPNLQILAASTSTTTHICRPAYIYIDTYFGIHTHAHTCRRTQAPSLDIRLQDPFPSIHSSNPPPSSPTSRGGHQSPNHPHPHQHPRTIPNPREPPASSLRVSHISPPYLARTLHPRRNTPCSPK